MEILWFIVGALAGALLVWWFLSARFSNRLAVRESELAAREAELQTENLKYKEAADEEREAREKTRALVTELEGKVDSTAEQAKTLSANLELKTGELGAERSAHAETKEKLTQAEAEGKSAGEQVNILKSELDELRRELEASKAAVADSDGKLSEERSARERLEADLQETRAQLSNAGSEDRARVAELEGRVRDRDAEIERLRAQTDAPGGPGDGAGSAPVPEKVAEVVSPQQTEPVEPEPAVAGATADDLTQIKGIGPVLKDKLHDLGITSFRQIADFTEADIERVNEVLNFPGRIERERWVEQARAICD